MRNFSALRFDAGEILAQSGNRLLFVGAQAIIVFSGATLLLLSYVLSLFLSTLGSFWGAFLAEAVAVLVLLILFTCILSPLCYGFFFMAKRAVEGKRCEITDLFYAFRSGCCYLRSVLALAGTVLAGAVSLALLMLLEALTPQLLGVVTPFVPFSLIGILVWWALASLFYTRTYAVISSEDLARPRISTRVSRSIRFWGGFLPWILLGILSVGVLLILDVIPRMVIARVLDCKELCPMEDSGIPEYEFYEYPYSDEG